MSADVRHNRNHVECVQTLDTIVTTWNVCRRWRQDRLARGLAWQVEDRDVKRRQTHTLSQNGGNPQRRLVRMVCMLFHLCQSVYV